MEDAMTSWIRTFTTLICIIAASQVMAEQRPADKCFRETVKALAGHDPVELTTRHCDRALRQGPHTAAHRAAMLHNRAIVERQMGDKAAAIASLRSAVLLAPNPGKPHLALAQLLHSQGQYREAVDQYLQIDTSAAGDEFLYEHRAAIARNLAAAQQALAFELAER
jgi:tetratricopeptide (TPR) repeat protein